MRAMWLSYAKVLPALAGALCVTAAVAVLAVLVALAPLPGMMLAGIALLVLALGGSRAVALSAGPAGPAAPAVLIAALGVAWQARAGFDPWAGLSCLLLLAAILVLPLLLAMAPPAVAAEQLPGFRTPAAPWVRAPIELGGALVALWALTGWPSWVHLIFTVLLLGVAAFGTIRLLRTSQARSAQHQLARALVGYEPRFAVYFTGRAEADYQVHMWLPYLERTGHRHVLLVREPGRVADLASVTDAPVVAVVRVEDLDLVVPDSVGAIFYVNNDVANLDGVRLAGPQHVHVGHGDSEKPSSYSMAFGIYDRVFVAGQAAIDRFARHGIAMSADRFAVVGRPQLEDVEVRSETTARSGRPMVLYAPTWRGGLRDMALSSLDCGPELVQQLLHVGAGLIFRPHPYSARDAQSRVLIDRIDMLLESEGGEHLASRQASTLTIAECFNRSDCAVVDVSSVASDYLYTAKPLALMVSGTQVDPADLPFAAACYQLGPGRYDALADLLGADPLASTRRQMRRYYLGDHVGAEPFVAAATEAITSPCPRQAARSSG